MPDLLLARESWEGLPGGGGAGRKGVAGNVSARELSRQSFPPLSWKENPCLGMGLSTTIHMVIIFRQKVIRRSRTANPDCGGG